MGTNCTWPQSQRPKAGNPVGQPFSPPSPLLFPFVALCTFAIKQMYFHIIFIASHPPPHSVNKCEYICKHVYECIYSPHFYANNLLAFSLCVFLPFLSLLSPFFFAGCFISCVLFTRQKHTQNAVL